MYLDSTIVPCIPLLPNFTVGKFIWGNLNLFCSNFGEKVKFLTICQPAQFWLFYNPANIFFVDRFCHVDLFEFMLFDYSSVSRFFEGKTQRGKRIRKLFLTQFSEYVVSRVNCNNESLVQSCSVSVAKCNSESV